MFDSPAKEQVPFVTVQGTRKRGEGLRPSMAPDLAIHAVLSSLSIPLTMMSSLSIPLAFIKLICIDTLEF